jgi:nitronate monooxygenase
MMLEIPIIQAPMAGGITTPQLIATVSNTGALGSLGAGYMPPEEIRKAIREIKALTQRPFSVNLFIPEKTVIPSDLSPINELLSVFWSELSDVPFEAAPFLPPSFDEQIEVILEERVPVFSCTFGIPFPSLIKRFKRQGTQVHATATTPEEAKQLEEAGVDAIVCQGFEAGGHRGNFSPEDPLYSLAVLLTLTARKVNTPLIAAGGIMNGPSAMAALSLGASAVQIGTAFLTTTESGAHPAYKEALLKHPSLPTTLTKAFTGRSARAIVNKFIQRFEKQELPPYPVQHYLTRSLRILAAQKQRSDLMFLLAGQGYPLCRTTSAAMLIQSIAEAM